MSTSPDTPESSDLPRVTHGPLMLILAALRTPASAALSGMAQLKAAGPLTPQQEQAHQQVMHALELIAHTVEQYSVPLDRQPAAARSSERWDAGEIPDALDDQQQDARLPLDDRPGRDSEQA